MPRLGVVVPVVHLPGQDASVRAVYEVPGVVAGAGDAPAFVNMVDAVMPAAIGALVHVAALLVVDMLAGFDAFQQLGPGVAGYQQRGRVPVARVAMRVGPMAMVGIDMVVEPPAVEDDCG